MTIHRAGTAPRTLSETATLTGDNIIAGFQMPVADIFALYNVPVRTTSTPTSAANPFQIQQLIGDLRADCVAEAYAPRRRVLDSILVNAAVDAGVELRQGFSVQELVWDQGRVVGTRGGTSTAQSEQTAPRLSSALTE